MAKNRKTKKEKVKTSLRRKEVATNTFQVKEEWLKTNMAIKKEVVSVSVDDIKFLKLDLTKTFFLSMLVLALEMALWQYFLRH